MKRKKSKRKSTSDPPGSQSPADLSTQRPDQKISAETGSSSARGPSQAIRTGLSLWVCLHLMAILISFTSVVEPSSIHARLAKLIHPYLRPAHFAADDRPVYLAHGNSSEQPHRLQVTTTAVIAIDAVETYPWQTVLSDGHRGLAVSDRTHRWLSTAAILAENEQPGLVAELLLPIAQKDPGVTAIRVVRLPTDLNDVNAEIESPYVARVIRDDNRVSLVQLKPARLSSQSLRPRKGQLNE